VIGCWGAFFLGGCSAEEYGYVSGQVTMDGQPMEGVFIEFGPREGQTATVAYGKTDEEGRYTMVLSDDHKGILPGTYRATLHTSELTYGDFGSQTWSQERVPERYKTGKEFDNLQVVAGESHTFDFKLTSDGEIIQPGGGRGKGRP
jgi:hypothetical protein